MKIYCIKSRFLILTFIITSFSISRLFSQETANREQIIPSNTFNISSGIGFYSSRDRLMSPLLTKGQSMPFFFAFQKKGFRTIHNIDFSYDNPNLTTSATAKDQSGDYIGHYATTSFIQLNYSFLWHLTHIRIAQVSVGGMWANNYFSKTYTPFETKSLNGYPLTDAFTSLNILFSAEKRITRKNMVKFSLSYPLVAFVFDSHYSMKQPPANMMDIWIPEENFSKMEYVKHGNLLTMNKFIDYRSGISFIHELNRNFDITVSYNFRYYQYPKLLLVKSGIHYLSCGINLNL